MSTRAGSLESHNQPLKFAADLKHLYEMLSYIKECAATVGFSKTVISKIELAGEEALVNIINHGCREKNGTIEISCHSEEGKSLIINIVDNGIPFNPLDAVKNFSPDSPEQSCDHQVGGYGIFFIVNMMDDVSYLRTEGKNSLLLTKHLEPKNP